MQQSPSYGDVVDEVRDYLTGRIEACFTAGIAADRLCIDPGFGFGKLLPHNIELLRRLDELTHLGPPLLVGLSRKSMAAALLRHKCRAAGRASVHERWLRASRSRPSQS